MIGDLLRRQLGGGRKGRPVHLILFVTDRCDGRCGSCFYWRELNKKRDLALENAERLARAAGPLLWLDLSGGEPSLHPDLIEICRVFAGKAGVRYLNVPTNGLAPERVETLAAGICRACPETRVNWAVSLDGPVGIHDAIRGAPGGFIKAMDTLWRLSALRRRHPNLAVTACTLVSEKNAPELPALLREVERGPRIDFHAYNIVRGEPRDSTLTPPSPKRFRAFLGAYQPYQGRYFRRRGGLGRLEAEGGLRLMRYLDRYYLSLLENRPAPPRPPCAAGGLILAVEPDGRARICELSPPAADLGDFDWDLRALLDSPAFAAARRERTGAPCPCTHANFQARNVMFHPRLALKALALGSPV